MLVWPQHRPVQIVQHAIAVRAEKRHLTGGSDKGILQIFLAGLGKPRRKAHGPAAPHGRQLRRYLDNRMAVDPEKGRVWRARQVGKAAVAGYAANLVALRVDRPDVTVESRFLALLNDIFRPPAAKNGDGTRTKQSRQVTHRAIPRADEAGRG